MTTVTEDLTTPGGTPQQAVVSIFLAGAEGEPLPVGYAMAVDDTVVGVQQVKVGTDGVWTVDLVGNAAITPAGTVYGVIVSSTRSKVDRTVRYITVPTAGGPYQAQDLLVDPPGSIDPTGLAIEVAARIAADNALQAQIDALQSDYFAALALDPDGLIVGTVIRDSTGAATSAEVVWPDGTPGTYTADALSTAFPGAVDAYHVTYGAPATRTYTQPAVARDGNGAVTERPEMVVS